MIRNVTAADTGQICAIYNHYIVNAAISFEEERVLEDMGRSRARD